MIEATRRTHKASASEVPPNFSTRSPVADLEEDVITSSCQEKSVGCVVTLQTIGIPHRVKESLEVFLLRIGDLEGR
jgi:hypothetical protein